MNQLKVILVMVAVSVGLGLGLLQNYVRSFHDVNVKLASSIEVSIYKDRGGDGTYNYDTKAKPLKTLTNNDTIRLKEGAYVFVVDDPSNQYENPATKHRIDGPNQTITINPGYTTEKLKQLLPDIRENARAALYTQYPRLPQNYTITADATYIRGEWYGFVIKPNEPQFDVVRGIMHKKDGSWRLETNPLLLSIGAPSHPDIPFEIVSAVNKL